MDQKEKNRLNKLNAKNGYGFSKQMMMTMITKHEKARCAGDRRTMEGIEYRLTQCNYHTECQYIHNGMYTALRNMIKKSR